MSLFDRVDHVLTALRGDSWVNALTGFGTFRDKTTATAHVEDPILFDEELTSLFNYDDLSNLVVSIVPEQMLRQGYVLTSKTPYVGEKLLDAMRRFDINTKLGDAMTWARLYGGSVIHVGANDGRLAEEPLDVKNITSVDFLDVHDRRRITPCMRYANTRNALYGSPSVYQLNTLEGGLSYIHESRLVFFRGVKTDDQTRIRLQGWDLSVLQRASRIIGQFNEAHQAARLMLTEANQSVFKFKGLMAMIAGGQRKDLETRAVLLDTMRSVSRAIFLDADHGEEYTKVASQFAGVADMMDRSAQRLSSCVRIPVTVLMGQSPAGLNATGASDIRLWYDDLASDQITYLSPRILKIARFFQYAMGLAGESIDVEHNSLWQETPREKADRRLVLAQGDAAHITSEVFIPEEVAAVRSLDRGWDGPIKLDPSLRSSMGLTPPAPRPPST